MIKTIFFDVDGTLYEEQHAKIKAEAHTVQLIAQRIERSITEVYELYMKAKWTVLNSSDRNPERNNRTLWYREMFAQGAGVEMNSKGLTAEKLSGNYWRILNENIEPYADLLLALPLLARKYELHILTDELYDVCQSKLETLGLRHFFGKVISAEHAGALKPHRELFDYALTAAGASADTTLMVGDYPAGDIAGAKSAGWHTALARRGQHFYQPHLPNEQPDYIVNSYLEFLGWVSSI
ncbi:MAG: HAD family hydrolase [Oscillospiraceae bacterium]|nr:HAD family hydrolase [Oscillospiraceae bacterium]